MQDEFGFSSSSWADHSGKNKADRRSPRKKLIQKQSFTLIFLMRPKIRTSMVDGKNEHLPSVLLFSDFFPASDNSAINTLKISFSWAFEWYMWRLNLIFTVLMAELSEAGKKSEKNKTERRCSFFPSTMAIRVLGLIKKSSLNDCFWISFLRW